MKPGCYWIRRRLPRARWGGTEPKLRTPVPNWSIVWGRCWKYFSSYSRRELVLQQADRWGLTRMGFSLPAVELLMWQLVSWTWVSGPGARDVALVCDFTGQASIKWFWKAAVPQGTTEMGKIFHSLKLSQSPNDLWWRRKPKEEQMMFFLIHFFSTHKGTVVF